MTIAQRIGVLLVMISILLKCLLGALRERTQPVELMSLGAVVIFETREEPGVDLVWDQSGFV